MISIVIATYNGSKYIANQLDSLRGQDRQADEVIIIDDFSADDTAALINKYIIENHLSHWILKINEKNLGYKESFYQGIKAAKGDLIFLCDQDDVWSEKKLSIMAKILEENPKIWALSCGVSLIDEMNHHIKVTCEKHWTNSNFLYTKEPINRFTSFDAAYIAKHNISPGCTMAFNRNAREGFLNTYEKALPHDWHINLIAAVNGGCVYLDENLVLYRRHENNAIGANTGVITGIKNKTRNIRIEDYQSRIDSLESILRYYESREDTNLTDAVILLQEMIRFYKNPSPFKLLHLYSNDGYKELAKKKIKLWEVIVAFHLDTPIRKLVELM